MFKYLIFSLILNFIISQKGIPFSPIMNIKGNWLNNSVTVVSSHYDIGKGKHGVSQYRNWWKKTLRLNCPYVIFTDDKELAMLMLEIRNELPTVILYHNMSEFFAVPLMNKNIVHKIHIPSIELGLIWSEKIIHVADAYRFNYFKSDWFAWVDSGNALYRKIPMPSDPWPNPNTLAMLPKDKIIYTCSWFPWNDIEIAGTSFMYHKDLVFEVENKIMDAYKKCFTYHPVKNYYLCGSDQYILTRVKREDPDFFHQIGFGYGDLVRRLFQNSAPKTNFTNFWDVCDKTKQVSPIGCDSWLVIHPV